MGTLGLPRFRASHMSTCPLRIADRKVPCDVYKPRWCSVAFSNSDDQLRWPCKAAAPGLPTAEQRARGAQTSWRAT